MGILHIIYFRVCLVCQDVIQDPPITIVKFAKRICLITLCTFNANNRTKLLLKQLLHTSKPVGFARCLRGRHFSQGSNFR